VNEEQVKKIAGQVAAGHIVTLEQRLLKQIHDVQIAFNGACKELSTKVATLASAEEARRLAGRQAACSHTQVRLTVADSGSSWKRQCENCGKDFGDNHLSPWFVKKIWRWIVS
jgi:hypothetical protein